jgi:predicted ATPase/DNA-binding CsgD family transcriptional regulator
VRPGQLPAPRTSLIGRDESVEALVSLLDGGARLVVVTGPGGVGKTRVTIEAARRLVQGCGRRASYVPLAGVADGLGLVSALFDVVGVAERSGGDRIAALVAALGDEPHLLVLDTFEHLLAEHRTISELLDRCPGLQVLVTSRSRVRIDGEQVVTLAPLTVPPEDSIDLDDVDAWQGSPAVQLFCDRAVALCRDFHLTSSNLPAVLSACRALDGLPLALELAAARMTLLTPQGLADELAGGHRSRLDLLDQGPRDLPARQQSLSETISWSESLLTDAGRVLFRRLAVFPAELDLDFLERVCAGPDLGPGAMLHELGSLVDLHLVEPAHGDDGRPRFVLLGTMREYAETRLEEAGESGGLHERYVTAVVELAAAFAKNVETAEEQESLDWASEHLSDLRAALAYLRDRRDRPRGVALSAALGRFWLHRGHMGEGLRWLDCFLSLSGAAPTDPLVPANARLWAARLAADEADVGSSEGAELLGMARDAVAVLTETGDVADRFRSAEHFAHVLTMRGELAEAEAVVDRAIQQCREMGASFWLPVQLHRAGFLAMQAGRHDAAVALADETIEAARASGQERMAAWGEQLLALLGGEGADTEAALTANLVAWRKVDEGRGTSTTLDSLGALAVLRGELHVAIGRFLGALVQAQRVGFWPAEAYSVLGIAGSAMLAGSDKDGARLHGGLVPHLPTIRHAMPTAFFSAYEAIVGETEDRLGPAAFSAALQAASTVWSDVVSDARLVAAPLAADPQLGPDGIEPVPAPPGRHRPASTDLSERELEVLKLIATGRTNDQIATSLHLSPKTVMHHSTRIYSKLEVRGRAEAVARGYGLGLLTAP